MYHKDQEEYVFWIIFTIVTFCQSISILYLYIAPELKGFLVIVPGNLLVFVGMVKYAQWLWKKITFLNAAKKIAIYELITIGIFLGLILFIRVLQVGS
jgi:hypothetical protein